MKKITPLVAVLFLISASMIMLQGCSPLQVRNAGLCGAAGAVAGAYLDKKDPVGGAFKGLLVGGGACAVITAMAEEAAQEAARTGRPAFRRRGNQMVESIPKDYNAQTRCRKIINVARNNGREVGRTEEEVCEPQKVTHRYRY